MLVFVFVLPQCFFFTITVDVFPSVLDCNQILFSFNRFMTFEQRYTTVPSIHISKINRITVCTMLNKRTYSRTVKWTII